MNMRVIGRHVPENEPKLTKLLILLHGLLIANFEAGRLGSGQIIVVVVSHDGEVRLHRIDR